MSRVARGTPSGDAYLDLQNEARRSGRPTQELLQLYVLEGFLARLAVSGLRDRFVLKGGVLLAAFDSRRPTKDVDLAGLDVANDTEAVLDLVRRVLAVEPQSDDGIVFVADTATAEVIREEDDDYSGVRVHVEAHLDRARVGDRGRRPRPGAGQRRPIGFNPELFGRRAKLIQLVRLIPFVERSYNLVELGPKGTGRSHIFSEFSPHGMLISGGEVTVPKLFVNNANGRIGLVGYWDVVAFDEFAGKKKRTDKALVDIMKIYMANKSFSRGVETLGAEASMVFVGNTSHNVPYMLKHSDLFDELPESYHDSAYLDRLHFYIPGWEVDTIRSEMFSDGYGFVVDYIAEVLKSMRDADYSNRYQQYFTLSSDISTRDRDGIHKTFSGLMKLVYPHGEATKEQTEELLQFAIEGRKRVKDQILRIDATMADVKFGYSDLAGEWCAVTTLEEDEYPEYYHRRSGTAGEERDPSDGLASAGAAAAVTETPVAPTPESLFEGHREFQENQRGVSYDTLLLAYLEGASEITIVEPYVRQFHQARNLMELIEALARTKDPADELKILLVTSENTDGPEKLQKQMEFLLSVKNSAAVAGITLDVKFVGTIHDRSIVAISGWRINLGRGLDILQFVGNDAFDIAAKLQKYRQVKSFSVTYIQEAASQ